MTRIEADQSRRRAKGRKTERRGAVRRRQTAQQALDSAKGLSSRRPTLDEVGAKAAAAASNLYREGRERLAGNEELSQGERTIERRHPQEPARCGWNRVFRRASARSAGSRLAGMANDIVGLAQQYAQQKAQTAVDARCAPGGVRARRRSLLSSLWCRAVRRAVLLADAAVRADHRRADRRGGRFRPRAASPAAVLMVGRRPAASAPRPAATPPQVASLWRRPRQRSRSKRPLLTAVLLAVALGMMARGLLDASQEAEGIGASRTGRHIEVPAQWPRAQSDRAGRSARSSVAQTLTIGARLTPSIRRNRSRRSSAPRRRP